jgi:hypothetical protein
VPEDVRVSDATPEEIETAIESLVQEAGVEDELLMSDHDKELLIRMNLEYWKDRPIYASVAPLRQDTLLTLHPQTSQISETVTASLMGALGIYGRFLRRQPIAWRWILLSGLPIYLGTGLWASGFAQPLLLGRGGPEFWWAYQIMNMKVRTEAAKTIAMARVERILKEGDITKLDGVLGSSSREQIISLPPGLLSSFQEVSEDQSESSAEETGL